MFPSNHFKVHKEYESQANIHGLESQTRHIYFARKWESSLTSGL